MQAIIRISLLFFVLFCSASAFTQGIKFTTLGMEEANKKAKAENKMLLIIVLKKNEPFGKAMEPLYKDASLGTFVNSKFISIKKVINLENDDDLDFIENLEIEAFPTFLFVDAPSENVYFTHVGRFQSAAAMLETAKTAVFGFCYAFNKVILDYPNNFKNIKGYKMENSSASVNLFTSTVSLPEVNSQQISEMIDPKTKKVISTSFQSVLEEKIRTKSLALAIMEDWRKEIMGCDFTAVKASAVNYRKENVDETEMIVINFKLPASPYSNFYIVLSLSPRDLFSVDTNYKLTLSIYKK